MCYHCATNPSIHHCCHRVAAISSPLSHHGVTFTVTSSWFRRCHYNVAFIVTLLQCRCRSRVIVVPSLSHCCSFVVAIMVSPSSLHCCGFVVAVMMSPSSSHCRGVRCHFIITVVVSPLSLHRHGVVIVVLLSLLQCHFCCHIVVTSRCHCCSHIVVLSWLWLWSWSHHGRGCGCIVVVAIVVASLWSLLLHCGHCC